MNEPPDQDLIVFTEAVQISAGERAAYLEVACGGDAELRDRVETLLRSHEGAGDFLKESPASAAIGREYLPSLGAKPGDRIGRYKLLQQIGEGGCGIVFMAEQEEPVRRLVALKVIKPGMDTKSVIARFEAERQALALMDHTNIAKVLDAGATDTGRPYFVMELVRGMKITDYCDKHSLATASRLDLFLDVCHAIQHAHQKGIIHRDIKPSNILVTTTEEGKALPKIIDFGIAKATTGQRLTDKTLFTAFELLIGTPAYMSPEQAALTSVDVDTRSDIYSLGVLLYELLTSTTPFDTRELLKVGFDEVRRVICNREPLRPSTRLGTMMAADLTNVSRHRQSEPPKLIRTLRGDLDWIVMKALEKDRARRYQTANGLALEVQRYLTGEPVLARPPSALYKFQKTLLRNRLLFFSLGGILILLVAGFGAVTWLLARENRAHKDADIARRQAETDKKNALSEAAKSQEITRFLKDMLHAVGPSVAQGKDTALMREVLDQTAGRVGQELTNQPATQAELRSIIGRVYQELGLYDQAETMLRAALVSNGTLFGSESKEVATSLNYMAGLLQQKGRLDEAESAFRKVLAMRQSLFAKDHPDIAVSLQGLAGVLWRKGSLTEAQRLTREALAMRRRLFGGDHVDVADSLHWTAVFLQQEYKVSEAEKVELEVLAMYRRLLGDTHPMVASSLVSLSKMLFQVNRLQEAEARAREALEMRRKLHGEEHPEVAACLTCLGLILTNQGKFGDAEATLREALAMQRKLVRDDNPRRIETLRYLGYALLNQGRLPEAENTFRDVLALHLKIQGEENLDVAATLNQLAAVLKSEGNLAEAETLGRRGLAIRRKLLGDAHGLDSDSLVLLIKILMDQKKLGEAETLMAELVTPSFPEQVYYRSKQAEIFARRSQWKEATAEAAFVVEAQPENVMAYHLLAPLLVTAKDSGAYQQLCQKMLTKFGNTTNIFVANGLIRDCLIARSKVDLNRISELAALTVRNPDEVAVYPRPCNAIAAYRLGHIPETMKWAQNALEHASPCVQAEGCLLLAMAHNQLGQKVEARDALAKGVALTEAKFPARNNGDLGPDWADWIILHSLLEEATEAIEEASAPGASATRQ